MAEILGLRQLFRLNIAGKNHASWPEVHKIYPDFFFYIYSIPKSTRSSDYQTYHSMKKAVIQDMAVHCDRALVQIFF